jgi:hypothetical protein
MPLHGKHRHFQRHLNPWIGLLFAIGSLLFLGGGLLALSPPLAQWLGIGSGAVNAVFFAGSVPFTSAAYLQLFQSANSTGAGSGTRAVTWFGWRPADIGWLACAMQFTGTVLFNVNTADALLPHLDWLQQDIAIWAPDMVGSALFLASGYLACVEFSRMAGLWQPRQRAWWITVINLAGCLAFMLSAFLAYFPERPSYPWAQHLATAFTAIGAAAFLAGSLLLLPEPEPDGAF